MATAQEITKFSDLVLDGLPLKVHSRYNRLMVLDAVAINTPVLQSYASAPSVRGFLGERGGVILFSTDGDRTASSVTDINDFQKFFLRSDGSSIAPSDVPVAAVRPGSTVPFVVTTAFALS